MTREEIKELADHVCSFATDVSWGFKVKTYWDGDMLVFRNAPNASENWWQTMQDDILACCLLIVDILNLAKVKCEFVEIDDIMKDVNEITEFKCGLKLN